MATTASFQSHTTTAQRVLPPLKPQEELSSLDHFCIVLCFAT